MLASEVDECSHGLGHEAMPTARWDEPEADLDVCIVRLTFESDSTDCLPVRDSVDQVVAKGALVTVRGGGAQEYLGADESLSNGKSGADESCGAG